MQDLVWFTHVALENNSTECRIGTSEIYLIRSTLWSVWILIMDFLFLKQTAEMATESPKRMVIPNNVSVTTMTVTVWVFVFSVTFSMNKHNYYTWWLSKLSYMCSWYTLWQYILLWFTYSIEASNHLGCKISIACYHTKAVLLWHCTWRCLLKIRTDYSYCHSIGIRRWFFCIQFILSAVQDVITAIVDA